MNNGETQTGERSSWKIAKWRVCLHTIMYVRDIITLFVCAMLVSYLLLHSVYYAFSLWLDAVLFFHAGWSLFPFFAVLFRFHRLAFIRRISTRARAQLEITRFERAPRIPGSSIVPSRVCCEISSMICRDCEKFTARYEWMPQSD